MQTSTMYGQSSAGASGTSMVGASTPPSSRGPTKRGRRPGRGRRGRALPDEQLIALGAGKGVAHKPSK